MFGHIIVYRSYLSLSCSYLRLLDQTLNTVLTLALSLEICTFRILANYIGIPQISRGFQIPKKRRGTPSHYQTLNLPKFFSRSFPKFLGVKRKPRSVLDSKTWTLALISVLFLRVSSIFRKWNFWTLNFFSICSLEPFTF